jgi:predicted transcriptional regulator
MMEKLFDSELKLMEIVWKHEPVSAKEISLLAAKAFDWNKNTTYTVIKRLIEKDVLRRDEPGFMCSSVVKKDEVQRAETAKLIDKLFGGSKKAFFAAFADEKLSPEEVDALRALIEKKR